MSEHRIIGVFGISGVGKSTLIAQVREGMPNSLHLQAGVLIKEGLADPMMHADALRRRSGDQIRSNQDILVESFWLKVRAQHYQLILFDGHLVIDTDDELFEIPLVVIGRLQPSLMVHVEDDVAKIAARRAKDSHKVRRMRSEKTLHEHQRISRRLCEAYASGLGIEARVLQPDEAECFSTLLRDRQS